MTSQRVERVLEMRVSVYKYPFGFKKDREIPQDRHSRFSLIQMNPRTFCDFLNGLRNHFFHSLYDLPFFFAILFFLEWYTFWFWIFFGYFFWIFFFKIGKSSTPPDRMSV